MRFGKSGALVALFAWALAVLLAPASAHAQPYKFYKVVTTQTDLGPLVIAWRDLEAAERKAERYEYEVLMAHAVWGHGYVRKTYTVDCAALRLPTSGFAFKYWPGAGPDTGTLEGAPEEDLPVLFASPQTGERFVAEAICRRKGDLATEMGAWEKLREGTGGPATHARRTAISWKLSPLAGLLAAFPGEAREYDSRKIGGAKGRVVVERTATRGGLTFAAGVMGIVPRPWTSASDAIRYHLRQLPAAGVRRRIVSSNSLMVDAPVSGAAGLYRVVRIETCELRGIPDWTVEISAEYRTAAERIEAWRFVNNTRTWCLLPVPAGPKAP